MGSHEAMPMVCERVAARSVLSDGGTPPVRVMACDPPIRVRSARGLGSPGGSGS
jgi:hypothetical protein